MTVLRASLDNIRFTQELIFRQTDVKSHYAESHTLKQNEPVEEGLGGAATRMWRSQNWGSAVRKQDLIVALTHQSTLETQVSFDHSSRFECARDGVKTKLGEQTIQSLVGAGEPSVVTDLCNGRNAEPGLVGVDFPRMNVECTLLLFGFCIEESSPSQSVGE